jgi:hypothetical protein
MELARDGGRTSDMWSDAGGVVCVLAFGRILNSCKAIRPNHSLHEALPPCPTHMQPGRGARCSAVRTHPAQRNAKREKTPSSAALTGRGLAKHMQNAVVKV